MRGLPKTTTTYARYVGRVGALAVALGIGVAVGTWPAVAFAEPTDAETSASPTDTTAQVTDDAPAEPVATVPDPTPTPSTPDAAPQADPAPSIPDPRDGIVQASGGAEVRTSSDPIETTPNDPQPKSDKHANDHPPSAEVSTPPANFTEVTGQRVESSAEAPPSSAVVDNVTAPSLVESATPVAVGAQDAPAPVSVAAVTDPPPAEASDVVSSVAAGLAAVLNPFAGNDEDAPADSPMAWTVLALTRRWSAEGDTAPLALRTVAASATPADPDPSQFILTTPLTGISTPAVAAFSPNGAVAYVTANSGQSVMVVNTANHSVMSTIPIGANPNGTAVSPDGNRVYTANLQGGVSVIDTATNSVVNTIPLAIGSLRVAVSPDGTRGYVTNQVQNTVTVINLTDDTVVTTLRGFNVPVHVALNPDGTRAYVSNVAGGPGSVTVIETATNTVIDTVQLGGDDSTFTPSGFGFSPDGSRLYVADVAGNNITVLNTADHSVVETISGITSPSALAISRDGSLAYVASADAKTFSIVSIATHAVVVTYQLDDAPNEVTVSPGGSQILITRPSANSVSVLRRTQAVNHAPVAGTPTVGTPDPTTGAVMGTLNFTDPDGDPLSYSVVANPAKGTLVVNPDGTFVYTPTVAARLVARTTAGPDLDSFTIVASDGSATAATIVSPTIDAARLVLSTPSTTAAGPVITSFTPDGARAYVAAIQDGTIKVYDTSTNALMATIPLGGNSEGVTVSPDGSRAYVAIAQGGIAIIDTASNTLVDTITGSPGPTRIVVTPDGTRAYVTNHSRNTVSVVDLTDKSFVDEITGFNGPLDIAVGRDGSRVYVTNTVNGPGSVKVIDTVANTVVDTIIDGYGFQPYGLTFNTDGSRLYIGDLSNNRVSVVDTATNAVVDHIGGLNQPTDVALSPDGSLLYAPNQGDDSVKVIDVATKAIVAAYSFADIPYKLAANPNGTQVYIGRTNGNAVSVLTLVSGENNAPVAGTPTFGDADAVTGAITGSLNFTDTDSDPLTYTYSGDSAKGALVVNADGTFVYTPNQAARLGAYQTAGPDFASFEVTASDGLATAAVIVAPPIAPGRLELTTPLTAGGQPSAVAFSPDGTRAYVTDYINHAVLVVDTSTNTVVNTIRLVDSPATYAFPGGIAVSADGTRAYVASANGGISIVDTATGNVVGNIPLANGSIRIALSPDGTKAYVSNHTADRVDVLDLTNGTVITSITDINKPFDIAVGPDGTRAYVITTANGPYSIKVIDTATYTVIDSVILRPQGYPTPFAGLTFSPDGSLLYTAAVQEGKVLALNTADNSVVETASGLDLPTAIALSPDGSVAYVANAGDYTVAAIDVATGAVLATHALGDNSSSIAANPNGLNAYVIPSNHDTVSVLTFVSLPLNQAPVAGIPDISSQEPTTGAYLGSLNFTDPDGDALTYSVAVHPSNGVVVINPDGTFVYTPDPVARHAAAADGAPLDVLTDHFIVQASDGIAGTFEYVQVSVAPLNHAPTPAGSMTSVPGLAETGSDFLMSADGSRAYVETYDPATGNTSLAMIDTATNAVTIVPLSGEDYYFSSIGFYTSMVLSPDGRHVYVTRKDAATKEYFLAAVDTTTGTVERIAFPQTQQLHASPDSEHIYGLNTTELAILDTETNQTRSVVLPNSVYKTLTMRPDGAGVVVTTLEQLPVQNGFVSVFSANVIDNDGTLTRYALPGNVATYVPATISSDGTHFYVATYRAGAGGIETEQRFLTVIDIPAGTSHDVAFAGDPRAQKALTVSPDGTRLYTVIDHHTLGILDADGNPVGSVELGGTYFASTFTPDGRQLYVYGNPSGDFDSPGSPPLSSPSLVVVDPLTLAVTTIALPGAAYAVTFSSDGAHAFAGPSLAAEVGYLSVVDTATLTVEGVAPVHGYVLEYAATPDGRYVSVAAASTADGTLIVTTLDLVSSTTTTTDLTRDYMWQSLGFTADGRQFYVSVYDYTDEWDASTYTYSVDSLTIPASAGTSSGVTVGSPAAGTGVVTGGIHYTDVDGDTLAYSVQTAPEHGTVTIDPATGGFTYTPDGSTTAATSTSFTVLVDDGHGAKVPVTVTVPIAALNQAPTVTIRPIAGDYATGVVTYEATATDADGDPLTYTVTADPARATVVRNADGTFTYTPTAAARHAASADNATYDDKWDTFTVTVTDPSGATGSAIATAMISPANAVPQPTRSASESAYGDPTITFFTEFRDDDSDAMTFTVTGGAKGTVSHIGNGNFTFTPTVEAQHAAAAPNATAADKFENVTVVANDGHGGLTTRTYEIQIKPQNTAPTVTFTQVGAANAATGAVTYQAVGTDPDGDALSYTVTANPTRGTLVRNTDGTYTYTPTAAARHDAALTTATAAQKQDTFTITASDGYGGVTPATATVTISTRNAAPTVTLTQIGGVNATTGAAVFGLTGADADGDPVTYTVNVDPARGSVVRNTNGTYTFTPTAAALHDAALTTATTEQKQGTFTVTADDAHGGITAVTATVTLPAKNVRPTVSLTQVSTDAATGAVTYRINGADADGDALSYTVGTNPGKGSVVVNTDGTLTYTPTDAARHAASASGATTALKRDTFSIVANDGHGGTVTSAIATVTVSPRNAAPAVTLSQVGGIDPTTGASIYRVNGVDPDGDSLTYTITTRPTKGTLVANADGTYTYTPTVAAAHAASADTATATQLQDTFTVTANDAHGATTPASATATITPRNAAPTVGITLASGPTAATGAVTYRVTGTDADRDTLTYTVTGDPTKGTLVRNSTGTYTYTPTAAARHDAAAAGATADQKQDTFTITANDAHGGTVVTTVTVTVSPKNTAPTATPTVGTPDAAGVVTGSVGAGDVDGDPLTYTVTGGPAKGSVVIDTNGGFTYTPSAAAQHAASADTATTADRRDTFTVTVTDGYGGTKAVTITAQVKPKNIGPSVTPTASSPTISTGGVAGTVGGSDGDNDTLTYTVTTRPGKGTLVLNADGTYTYTPTAAARTTASKPTATAAQKQDTFAITVKDGHGGTAVVTYTVPLSLTTSGTVVIVTNPPSPL